MGEVCNVGTATRSAHPLCEGGRVLRRVGYRSTLRTNTAPERGASTTSPPMAPGGTPT